jgi:hypothetical protein
MAKYVRVNGQQLAPAVARDVARMSLALQREFDEELLVSSGRRSSATQKKIFLERYRPQLRGSGPFGDVRFWNRVRYVRVKAGGTVAQPGTSRHESDRAVDVRDSGRDAGVTRRNNPRSNWLRKNARRFGFEPIGYTFGEPWHLDYRRDPWARPKTRPKARPRPVSPDGDAPARKPKPAPAKPAAAKPAAAKRLVVPKRTLLAVEIPTALAKNPPVVSVDNLGLIGDVRGLQKIARLYGGETDVDNEWGSESREGFRRFLRANYGGSIMRWLRDRWGYNGNERMNPAMIAALLHASRSNFKAL